MGKPKTVASRFAAEGVSVRQLFPSDLLELADAISLALADHTQPYPPRPCSAGCASPGSC